MREEKHEPAHEPVEVLRPVDHVLQHLAGFLGVDRPESDDLLLGQVLLQNPPLLEELRAILEEGNADPPSEAVKGHVSANGPLTLSHRTRNTYFMNSGKTGRSL